MVGIQRVLLGIAFGIALLSAIVENRGAAAVVAVIVGGVLLYEIREDK